MKTKELSTKSKTELEGLLEKERADLMKFRFNISGGKVKNVKGHREIRKNIARILTLLK